MRPVRLAPEELALDSIPSRRYLSPIHVDRFPRVFAVLRARKEMVADSAGGCSARTRCAGDLRDQFRHCLGNLSFLLSDAVLAKHPGDFRILP